MAARRGEGRQLELYVRMFNDPAIARLVSALGGHLRYDGQLPGDVRELVILHVGRSLGVAYEWAHHVGPARAEGVEEEVIEALRRGQRPEGLRPEQAAALEVADAVLALQPVPASAHAVVVDRWGPAGAVELAILVGTYRLVGGFLCAFEVPIEPDLDEPTFG